MPYQPVTVDASGKRTFSCFAAAVIVFIIDEDERFLMLSSPGKREREGAWETISGALEADETVLQGAIRETQEEIGIDANVRPLGTVHAHTFCYDDRIQHMISICYLMAYGGGQIRPGDDMHGSQYRWMPLRKIEAIGERIVVPSYDMWLFRRAAELYRLWKHQEIDEGQLGLEPMS